MLFNFLWFLPCWCVSQLIQKPTEFWKGKKWEKRLRKREGGKTEECVWLAQVCCSWQTVWEPRGHCVSSCMCECCSETERLKKDRHGKHAHWHFLIKYGNQGANQQHSICDPFLIHYQKLCKWGRYWERLSGGERERNGGEGKREREMQVITSLFTDLMRAM